MPKFSKPQMENNSYFAPPAQVTWVVGGSGGDEDSESELYHTVCRHCFPVLQSCPSTPPSTTQESSTGKKHQSSDDNEDQPEPELSSDSEPDDEPKLKPVGQRSPSPGLVKPEAPVETPEAQLTPPASEPELPLPASLCPSDRKSASSDLSSSEEQTTSAPRTLAALCEAAPKALNGLAELGTELETAAHEPSLVPPAALQPQASSLAQVRTPPPNQESEARITMESRSSSGKKARKRRKRNHKPLITETSPTSSAPQMDKNTYLPPPAQVTWMEGGSGGDEDSESELYHTVCRHCFPVLQSSPSTPPSTTQESSTGKKHQSSDNNEDQPEPELSSDSEPDDAPKLKPVGQRSPSPGLVKPEAPVETPEAQLTPPASEPELPLPASLYPSDRESASSDLSSSEEQTPSAPRTLAALCEAAPKALNGLAELGTELETAAHEPSLVPPAALQPQASSLAQVRTPPPDQESEARITLESRSSSGKKARKRRKRNHKPLITETSPTSSAPQMDKNTYLPPPAQVTWMEGGSGGDEDSESELYHTVCRHCFPVLQSSPSTPPSTTQESSTGKKHQSSDDNEDQPEPELSSDSEPDDEPKLKPVGQRSPSPGLVKPEAPVETPEAQLTPPASEPELPLPASLCPSDRESASSDLSSSEEQTPSAPRTLAALCEAAPKALNGLAELGTELETAAHEPSLVPPAALQPQASSLAQVRTPPPDQESEARITLKSRSSSGKKARKRRKRNHKPLITETSPTSSAPQMDKNTYLPPPAQVTWMEGGSGGDEDSESELYHTVCRHCFPVLQSSPSTPPSTTQESSTGKKHQSSVDNEDQPEPELSSDSEPDDEPKLKPVGQRSPSPGLVKPEAPVETPEAQLTPPASEPELPLPASLCPSDRKSASSDLSSSEEQTTSAPRTLAALCEAAPKALNGLAELGTELETAAHEPSLVPPAALQPQASSLAQVRTPPPNQESEARITMESRSSSGKKTRKRRKRNHKPRITETSPTSSAVNKDLPEPELSSSGPEPDDAPKLRPVGQRSPSPGRVQPEAPVETPEAQSTPPASEQELPLPALLCPSDNLPPPRANTSERPSDRESSDLSSAEKLIVRKSASRVEELLNFNNLKKLQCLHSDASSSQATPSKGSWSPGELTQQMIGLMVEDMASNKNICNCVKENLERTEMSSSPYLTELMTAVCQAAVKENTTCRVHAALLQGLPVVLEDRHSGRVQQMKALKDLQVLIVALDRPPNLLRIFFQCMFVKDVSSNDASCKSGTRRDLADQLGNGVALKTVTNFFTWLREA